MSKLQVPVRLVNGRKRRTVQALVDSGSSVTVFPHAVAQSLGLKKPRGAKTEELGIMGRTISVWYIDLGVDIPDTDCLVEDFEVAFAEKASNREDDLLHGIVGVDFLQRTGGLLDFGKNRHAIACDPNARGEHSDTPVIARRKRLKNAKKTKP